MAPAVNTRLAQKQLLLLLLMRRRRQRSINYQTQHHKVTKRKRRWWVRPAWKKRAQQGQFHTIYPILRTEDREMFFRYTRMSPDRFDHLLLLVKEDLEPKITNFREGISAEQKLLITLRYLATGDSQQSQSFNFHVGRSTVSNIIKQICSALWDRLAKQYLKFPTTMDEWKRISDEYSEEWNFPHVVGALDGKHVRMDCPKYGGSLYYNYKSFHSLVLMAMCDAHYKFVYVDIGHYGKDNDAGIFSQSNLYEMLDNEKLPLPEPGVLNGKSVPHFIIGDEIFPLKTWLMKPYGGKELTLNQRVYNYRLSRARSTIENAFGILAARWRIFHRAIRADVTTVDHIIKATTCLHNYLMCTDNARYVPTDFIDCYNNDEMTPGDWRSIVQEYDNPALAAPPRLATRNYSHDAKQQRDNLCHYVNSEEGAVEWQIAHVTSCGPRV